MMVPSSVWAVTCSSDSGNPSRSITRLWYLAAWNGVVSPCSRAPRHHAQQGAQTYIGAVTFRAEYTQVWRCRPQILPGVISAPA